MSLEVYGKVSISCEAKREWHQPRANGKRRRRWLGMFVKVEWALLTISPDVFGDATLIELPAHDGVGELDWGSLLIGRTREYRESNIQALVSDPLWKQELRSTFSIEDDIDEDILNNSRLGGDADTDVAESDLVPLTGRKTFLPSSMFLFWGHNSDLPDFGYNGIRTPDFGYIGARIASRESGARFGDWTYRMECPCGYRIRDISSNELHPVLDQLSAGGMHSISIQRLLPILDHA